ncbi:UNVERIFIED_CONTAM: Transposon Ty3-G Gag-Pol polyprotein [Sesamum radiatum]|uniref:Transposon Ty3-G Gag-Pol polyprotein n=1 Tax=Sesamum radiatum TaxID=300843 RepID=A0AAW2L311_SESRA
MPYPGLLQLLAIPTQAWASISMDFIEGLPKSEGKDCILVVVDRLTKYVHFLALTHPFSAETVARIFMDHIYKLHGLPINIVSDRDKVFTGTFWKELFKLLGTTLSLSTAYHPQTDGQTERVNQCVENYLRCMCHMRPKQWNRWLSLAEYWYNTNFHTGLKLIAFQALYGYLLGPLTIDPYIPTTHPEVEEYLQERSKLLELLKLNLTESQNRMKNYADKHRTERSFELGDFVYLRLQPYRQSSLQLRRNLKLAPKYYGPFQVLEKIGEVAYRLKLPPSTNIHSVFHISLLKRKIGHKHTPTPHLPDFSDHGICRIQPIKILARHLISRRNTAVPQILVQWAGYPESESTWEDYYDVVSKFPNLDGGHRGRRPIQPGGNVTTLDGGRRHNLGRPTKDEFHRMIKGSQAQGNDAVSEKGGKVTKCCDVVLGAGPL